MQKSVSFYSAGVKRSGYLHADDGGQPRERRPGVVVCTGFAAVQAFYLPEICDVFARAGYPALRFDYRGFGESDGARGRVVPMEHVEDIRSAITFLQQQPEVDPERIGLYGTSFGGAHVSYTAAVDERVDAIHAERQKRFPGSVSDIVLESGDAIVRYAPEDVVHRIAPRAILWIHAGNDELVPPEESEAMYARAGEPKKLVVLPGLTHYDVYTGDGFAAVMRESLEWFRKFIPVS